MLDLFLFNPRNRINIPLHANLTQVADTRHNDYEGNHSQVLYIPSYLEFSRFTTFTTWTSSFNIFDIASFGSNASPLPPDWTWYLDLGANHHFTTSMNPYQHSLPYTCFESIVLGN